MFYHLWFTMAERNDGRWCTMACIVCLAPAFRIRLIVNHFGIHIDEHSRAAPDLGIVKLMPAGHCPWPVALAQRVGGVLSVYHSWGQLRYNRDLARAWP